MLFSKIVKKKIRKGIPDCLRGIIWTKLTEITKIKKEYNESYNVNVVCCF